MEPTPPPASPKTSSSDPLPPLPPLELTDADRARLDKLTNDCLLLRGDGTPGTLEANLGDYIDMMVKGLLSRPAMFVGGSVFSLELTWQYLLDAEVLLRSKGRLRNGFHPHALIGDFTLMVRMKRYPKSSSRTGVCGVEPDQKALSRFYEEVRQLLAQYLGPREGQRKDQTEEAWREGPADALGTGIFLVYDPLTNDSMKVLVDGLTYAEAIERGQRVEAIKWVPRSVATFASLHDLNAAGPFPVSGSGPAGRGRVARAHSSPWASEARG